MIEKTQKHWMPLKGEYGGLEWLCDHLGDAIPAMDAMWAELCRLRQELPSDGFENNDNL
jgi:hypothetical protein